MADKNLLGQLPRVLFSRRHEDGPASFCTRCFAHVWDTIEGRTAHARWHAAVEVSASSPSDAPNRTNLRRRIGAAIHDAVCDCLDKGFGYTLRSRDLDAIKDAAMSVVAPALAERDATIKRLTRERDEAQAAIRDIDAHATPVGLLHEDDPEGSPHHYLVTVGALHRALGKSNGTGVKCDLERNVLRWLHAEARYHRDVAHQMLERLETQHVTWTVAGSTEEIHPDWCRECRVDRLRAERDKLLPLVDEVDEWAKVVREQGAEIQDLTEALALSRALVKRRNREYGRASATITLLWLHAEAVWQRDQTLAGDAPELQRATDLVAELRKHVDSLAKVNELQRAELARKTADYREASEDAACMQIRLDAANRELAEQAGQPDTEATGQVDTCRAVGFWGARNTRYECDKPKGHTEKPHENSSESPAVIWFGDHAEQPVTPATPTEPRAVYHDPGNVEYEYDEDDNPINPSVGWDIAWGCRVSFGHDDDGWRVTASVSDAERRNGGAIRTVTRDQLRKLAHQLIELTEVVETTPSGIPDSKDAT